MSQVSEHYSPVADGFAACLADARPDRWLAPSPCTDWTARDVVVHVINTHHRVLATLDGSEPQAVTPDDDLPARWSTATAALRDALNDDVRASQVVASGFGEQSFESLVDRLLCADTLLHTWDLARATDQEAHLDPVAVSRTMGFLGPLDEAIRRPGGFGPKIDPAQDADEQTMLLNFCGRAV
jgi:uncharacterized protein (TIGR03086 family)